MYELLAQRITGYVEPSYVSDDMLRGKDEEIDARAAYAEKYAPVREVGFVTNDRWGFAIGYSPDGLVGEDGQIEAKSRRQKFQIQTIIDGVMDSDFVIQAPDWPAGDGARVVRLHQLQRRTADADRSHPSRRAHSGRDYRGGDGCSRRG